MAEFEFAGMTFKGGKMFLILTALSTLGGAAWGAFEFYNDYRNMKAQIEEYVAPDLSHIEQQLAVQQETMDTLTVLVESLEAKLDDTKDTLVEDMDKVETIARRVDDKTAETQREVRDDVYAMEQKVNERMRTLDQDVRELRKDLENKIQTILDNPLNN
jgi:BMFP domain-containing protein YqiC